LCPPSPYTVPFNFVAASPGLVARTGTIPHGNHAPDWADVQGKSRDIAFGAKDIFSTGPPGQTQPPAGAVLHPAMTTENADKSVFNAPAMPPLLSASGTKWGPNRWRMTNRLPNTGARLRNQST